MTVKGPAPGEEPGLRLCRSALQRRIGNQQVRRSHKISPPQRQAQLDAKPAFQSVYDGRVCLGHILNRGKLGFEAFDADDSSLGTFPDQKSAADAISTLGVPDAAGLHALTDRGRRHG
jgi:hypothetical protein